MKKPSELNGPDMSETDDWLRFLYSKGRKTNTLRTHRVNVKQCLKLLYDSNRPTKASEITTDDIQFLWRELDVKEDVRHSYLRSLSCMVMHYTKIDIVKQTSILYNRENCDRVFISKDEFTCAYKNADPMQRLILCLGAYMGLRRVEMSEIRDGDIDGDVMVVHGKGHGEEGFVTKVRIPSPVMQAVDEYRRSPMKSGNRLDDYLLQVRTRGGELHGIPVNRISNQMTELGKKTGIRLTTHSLRRFYATILYYETNSDLQTLKNLMRHANVSTTLRCYVNAYDLKEREAGDQLTSIISDLVKDI